MESTIQSTGLVATSHGHSVQYNPSSYYWSECA